MKELCVVHLVRAQNEIEPFRRFLESYRENPGGIEHDLLIVFKGFAQPQDTAEYLELLAPIRYATFQVPDEGFDITAYFAVVKRYSEQYRYFCFLNSYSVILDHDWLRKLHENISNPEMGVVGSTGSWQSHRGSMILTWRLPIDIALRQYRLLQEYGVFIRLISAIHEVWRQIRLLISYDRFPNYHIRTNAFMISGELMKKLKCSPLRTKEDAYRFESGKKGFTKQILNRGKRVIVVGKDGQSYEKENWRTSMTFRQSEQENLLVADNQTRDYQNSLPERCSYLSDVTWGETNGESGNR